MQLDVLTKVDGIEPTNFIVSLPELAGLVDIDLACLLGVGPAELFADSQGIDASLEDTSLAAKVGGTAEAKCGSKFELSLMQEVAIGVTGDIELVALPFSFQLLLVAHQRRKWWRVILEGIVVRVVACGSRTCSLGRDASNMLFE